MNVYEASRKLLDGHSRPEGMNFPPEWTDYIRSRRDVYHTLLPDYVKPNMRSEAMWVLRGRCASGDEVDVVVGVIILLELGRNRLHSTHLN